MKKKKIIIITLVGIALIGLLVWYLKKPNVNNDSPTIDTGEIKETTLKWEDVVEVDISGFEGDLIANISYKEIPELQEKIEVEEEKWGKARDTFDPNEDASTIENYLNWLSEIRKPYNENFCELPADLNVKKKGDVVKVTCNSDVLKKLNYKFNDGFEVTLENVVKGIDEETKKKHQLILSTKNDEDDETNIVDVPEIIAENDYSVYGDDLVITVEDINTVNLNQVKYEGQRIMVVVGNQDDFETVKKHALKYGNIDSIQLGDDVYGKESNYEEAEEWRGISMGD